MFDHEGLRQVQTILYLTKTFAVETLHYCNPLSYVKCSTSLLTFKAVATSLRHIVGCDVGCWQCGSNTPLWCSLCPHRQAVERAGLWVLSH